MVGLLMQRVVASMDAFSLRVETPNNDYYNKRGYSYESGS